MYILSFFGHFFCKHFYNIAKKNSIFAKLQSFLQILKVEHTIDRGGVPI